MIMIKFKNILQEMAKPRDIDLRDTYYHGTPIEEYGEKIMREGIKPASLEIIKKKYKRISGGSVPIKGKVYITPSLEYAVIYSLGGVWMGHIVHTPIIAKDGRYGYLFVVDGAQLKDIQPDEDSIGEIAHHILHDKDYESIYDPELEGWLKPLLYDTFGRSYLEYGDFAEGMYDEYIHVGKELLNVLSDEQQLAFIDAGAHIAHGGELKPKESWRIDKYDSKLLKPDGGNFFEIAERVK